ncbi:MAG: ribosome recycling factor [Saprospiraceae bacterium]|nr:ribosome recycling factor [Saprospiraceae bacterium]MDW8484787.1 ribosome recycling factor [Saprospiraceae bacterium]
MEDISHVMSEAQAHMERAVEHLNHEMVKLRTGKASPVILQDILIEYYGSPTPLHQVANIQVADARTLVIQPWERNMLAPIERAIVNANLGITPANDGEVIRLTIPPLTEERRRELVKKLKHAGEESKIGVRNARHKALDHVKKAMKAGYPEDLAKRAEHDLQEMVNRYVKRIDDLVSAKEKEIMTI